MCGICTVHIGSVLCAHTNSYSVSVTIALKSMQFWVIIVVPSLHLGYGTEKGPGVSKLVDQSLCVKYNPCLCKAQCLRYSHVVLVSLSCRPFLFYCCCSLKFVLKILLFPFCSSFLPQASFPQCLLV